MAETLSTVTVHRFRLYDITTDEMRLSRRFATREAIEQHRGEVIEDTAVEIDSGLVGAEVPGMTARNFNPNPRTGFQSQVVT